MLRLIVVGLLAGLFFSTTFILNKAMSLGGGHWLWSASLRYLYMIVFLLAFVAATRRSAGLRRIFARLLQHPVFWCLAGGVGFGGFYALICFSTDYAPGWVIASTWQLTIIASLVVLRFFGRSFPFRTWLFSGIVFAGVVLVNLASLRAAGMRDLLLGGLPVLVAAFCYPIGNQLVWEASHGNRRLPDIGGDLAEHPLDKVLLLSLGSLPVWIVLVAMLRPPPPSAGQLVATAMVAVFSGVVATGFFLAARNRAKTAGELAAVDATQSSEVVFAMLGEILFLHAALPNAAALWGVVLIFSGLGLFIGLQKGQA